MAPPDVTAVEHHQPGDETSLENSFDTSDESGAMGTVDASGDTAEPGGDTAEPCGLRERKKRETRRALNLAALDLVEERGFAAVTTEEIAARAGVSTRTFFNYFPSKEAAVIGTTIEQLESYAVLLEEVREGEAPLDALRRIVAGMLAPPSFDRELRARRRRILLGEPSLAPALVGNNLRIEAALTAALERRLGVAPNSSLAPRLTVAAAIAAVRACIEHQQNGGSGRLERNIDVAFDALRAGLR